MSAKLSSMDRDKLNKWKKWSAVIHQQVRELCVRHEVWTELVEIINSNPDLRRPSVFYEWLPIVYGDTQVMSVRRMADLDPNAISLAGLMVEIRDNPDLARKHAENNPIVIDGDVISRDVPDVDAHLILLKEVAGPLQAYADKRIAHYDGKGPKSVPKFSDFTRTVDVLADLAVCYYGFTHGIHEEVKITFAYPWTEIFTIPWISGTESE